MLVGNFQVHGPVSHSSQHSMKSFQMGGLGAVNHTSSNIQARLFMTRSWSNMSITAQQQRKSTLGFSRTEARKLRGIRQIDPDNIQFKNTKKNARKNMELPLETAMLCKIHNPRHSETCCTDIADQETLVPLKPTNLRERALVWQHRSEIS